MKPVRALLLAAASLAMAASAWAEEAVGKWSGVISGSPQGDLPLVVTVTKGVDGKLTGTLESVAQAPGQPFPLDTISSDGKTISWTLAMVGASYTGKWDAAQKAWVGTFTQGGDVALSFKRVS